MLTRESFERRKNGARGVKSAEAAKLIRGGGSIISAKSLRKQCKKLARLDKKSGRRT